LPRGSTSQSALQSLTLDTHRERQNSWQSAWLRRARLALPTALAILALLNAFGQRPHASIAAAPEARPTVVAPVHARSGLIFAARFPVGPHRQDVSLYDGSTLIAAVHRTVTILPVGARAMDIVLRASLQPCRST
jgi:hypothetical protein